MAKVARKKKPALMFQDNALLDPTRQAGLLDQIKAAGGTGIQQDVVYGGVHKNGGYDLATTDALVNAARQRGLAVRMRLMGTPRYMATSQPGADASLGADHPNPVLMRRFAADMAKRYAGRVGGYSIWNEPNVGSFLNRPTAEKQAATYRKLYEAGYAGVKGAHKQAKVGFGEITSQTPTTPGAYTTIGFLKEVLQHGKPLRADYASIHPYQWSDPGKTPAGATPWYGGISNLPAVQAELKMQARARRFLTPQGGQVPLSLSEYGYKHDSQPNPTIRAQWLQKSMQLAQKAGVQDVNMYQVVPSKAGDYWDSSIADARGVIDPRVRKAIKRGRRVP